MLHRTLRCSGSACDTPPLFFSLFSLLSLAQKSFSCMLLILSLFLGTLSEGYLLCHLVLGSLPVPSILFLRNFLPHLNHVTQSAKELSFQRNQNSCLNLSSHTLFVPCNLIPIKYGLLKFNLWMLLTLGICEAKKHS